jgi:hypothetical protein
VNLHEGEFVGVGSATPAVVLLTPDALVLKMQLGETDYPNVKLNRPASSSSTPSRANPTRSPSPSSASTPP